MANVPPTLARALNRIRLNRIRLAGGRLADESGVALVLVMVIVLALSISTAAIAQLMTSNEKSFGRDRQANLAFNTAEAGLNYGISYLAKTADPNGTAPVQTLFSQSTPQAFGTSTPQGTGTGGWWAEKTDLTHWTVHANGTSPDSTVKRELQVNVVSKTLPGTVVPASLAWGYGLFVANPGPSCFNPSGNANITISIYVNGCLKLSGSAGIAEPVGSTGPSIKVYAATTISFQGGAASIGTSGQKVASVTAPGGCTGSGGVICSNTPSSKVWAMSYVGPAQSITKPTIAPDTVYAMADWKNGPLCTGSGYPTFDGDTTRNLSAASPNLFPGTTYSCTIYKTSAHTGTPVGILSWNAATSRLTATGTLFFDSNFTMNNASAAYTNGTSATFYFDGSGTINGNAAFCGPPSTPSSGSCTGTKWDGAQGAIVLAFINASSASPGLKVNGTADINVAVYVVGNYTNLGNAAVTGPIITDTATVSGSSSSSDVSNPPDTAPGATYTNPGATDWGVVPGTWAQNIAG